MDTYNYKNIATIIVDKIIAYQIKLISESEQINDIIMHSECEYEYHDYIFTCEIIKSEYEPKYLNLQLIFKWFVAKKNYPSAKVLFGSIFQHYIGNESDIMVLNSELDSETLENYHKIMQIIYAYVRHSIENTYDSILLDYIQENDYLMITKYELLNQVKLELENESKH